MEKMRSVHIYSCSEKHTTAWNFYSAIKLENQFKVLYWTTPPKVEDINKEDIFWFIDPPPNDWPDDLYIYPCVTIAYLIDVHQGVDLRKLWATFFDLVFIAQKDYLAEFVDAGFLNVFWMPLACNSMIYSSEKIEKIYDVGFVGKLGPRNSTRYRLLANILPRYKTNNYRQFYKPIDMGRIYQESKIVFNASINNDLNMRVFEAMGSGGLLITDRIENGLEELFEEGKHYVAYNDEIEAIEKIEHYLFKHDVDLKRIAECGRNEVFKKHTYNDRWEVVKKHIVKLGQTRPAQIRNSTKSLRIKSLANIYKNFKRIDKLALLFFSNPKYPIIIYYLIIGFLKYINSYIPLTPGAIQSWAAKID